MASSAVVELDDLRSLLFSSISGSYVALGSPFEHIARLICITNNTDGDIFFSTDGTNDKLFVARNSFKLFDLTTNRAQDDTFFVFIKGTQFYVRRSSVPTQGSVYLEVIYGSGE